jgi:hypothetical protein
MCVAEQVDLQARIKGYSERTLALIGATFRAHLEGKAELVGLRGALDRT